MKKHFAFTVSFGTCFTTYATKFMTWLELILFAAFYKRLYILLGTASSIAFNRAKPCPSENACNAFTTYRALLIRFRTCVITSVFPVLQFRSYYFLQLLILACANNIKRQRQLALSSFNDFTLAAVRPFPTLDFNVISIVNKKIRTIRMLSPIWQLNEKSSRFIYERTFQIFQITSIIGFPSRATIYPQIRPEVTFAKGISLGYSVGTWLSNPRQCMTASAAKAGRTPSFPIEFLPALQTYMPTHISDYGILSRQLQSNVQQSKAQKGVM